MLGLAQRWGEQWQPERALLVQYGTLPLLLRPCPPLGRTPRRRGLPLPSFQIRDPFKLTARRGNCPLPRAGQGGTFHASRDPHLRLAMATRVARGISALAHTKSRRECLDYREGSLIGKTKSPRPLGVWLV